MVFQRRKYLGAATLLGLGLLAHLYGLYGMFAASTYACTAGLGLALAIMSWGERNLHPVTILIFTSSLYFLAAPFDLISSNDFSYFNEYITFNFMLPNMIFLATLLLFTPAIEDIKKFDLIDIGSALHLRNFSVVATLISVLIYFTVNIPQFGFNLSVALNRGELQISLGAGGFFAEAAIAAFALLHALVYFRYGTRVSLLVISAVLAYCAYDVLILGDRRPAVGLVLGLIAIRAMERGFRFRLHYIPVVLSGALILQIWTFGRSIGVLGTLAGIVDGSFWQIFKIRYGETEFAAAALVLNQQWHDLQVDFMWSYRYLPVQLVPNFLLNPLGIEQPDSPSLYFVKNYFPTVAAEGGAFGYNIVLEAYQNFGILGYVLVPALLARMVGWLTRIMPISQSLFYALFIATCGFLIRLDMSNLKAWVYSCLILFATVRLYLSVVVSRQPSNATHRSLRGRTLL